MAQPPIKDSGDGGRTPSSRKGSPLEERKIKQSWTLRRHIPINGLPLKFLHRKHVDLPRHGNSVNCFVLRQHPFSQVMPDARFQPLPGFRDFAPADCAVRNYLFNAWKRVAHRYGFLEWEGPTVEATELYLKKSGGELPTQLFRFTDQGDRDSPSVRNSPPPWAASPPPTQREYTKPLKWFEIGSCFRYEKPQKGRLARILPIQCGHSWGRLRVGGL